MDTGRKRVSLGEIFTTFFYIGATGFGGGMAIVSLMERVCVHRKRWLGLDEFMHGLAFGQILGPFSLNTSVFIGYYLRGSLGGIAAAVGFIAPSFFLISLLSWLYFKFHELPQLQAALKGTNPVVIALIVVAAVGMTRSKVKGINDWLMVAISFAAVAFFNVNALVVLVLAGIWALGREYYRKEHQ
ncbi:chromate transporter [Geotalea sp. SG265]|uniref:chromate transporter n=1 Tax=Geotalea sp. SG265 TaxID=2922867 RepID=UPI001FAFEB23|nr:chromate transporter [Geotalea sp. SG265]